VSDFGFARLLKSETSVGSTRATVGPIKHMAPESLTKHIYSEKTDVWAFGVTCFEITTRTEPYPELDYVNSISFVVLGGRLEVPLNIQSEVSDMMKKCWETDPVNRPSLQECFDLLYKLENEL